MKIKKIILYTCSFLTLVGFVSSAFPITSYSEKETQIEHSEPYYLGELGSDWTFPSDHLPIGATIGDVHIAFWNILNKKYLHYIEKNTQGLKDSSIMKDNFPLHSKTSLTVREEKICSQIFEMISHPTHPRSLIALQETSDDVLNYLTAYLPERWVIITPPDQPLSQDVFLYDSERFDFVDLTAKKYSEKLPKTICSLTLRDIKSSKKIKFVQSHIPGGTVDSPEGCRKFSDEALSQFDPEMIIVLLGDMNQHPRVIEKALNSAKEALNMETQPYTHLPISYPTHIDTNLNAAWIDNFFIYQPPKEKKLHVSSSIPSEISSMAPSAAELLKN